MKLPSNISYTAISTFRDCPLKYYKTYVSGEIRFIQSLIKKESPYLNYGSLIHKAMEMCVALEIKDLDKLLKNTFDMIPIRLSSFNIDDQTWRDDIVRDVTNGFNYLKSIDIWNRKCGTETFFETNLEFEYNGETYNQRIVAVIDLWYFDGNDIHIVDYKTGRSKTLKQVDENDQLTLYTLMIQDNFDKFDMPIDLIIPKMVYLKDNKVVESRIRSDKDIERLLDEIYDILTFEDYDNLEKPTSWICKDCPAASTCKLRNKTNSLSGIKRFSI